MNKSEIEYEITKLKESKYELSGKIYRLEHMINKLLEYLNLEYVQNSPFIMKEKI